MHRSSQTKQEFSGMNEKLIWREISVGANFAAQRFGVIFTVIQAK